MLPRNHPDRIQIAFDDHRLVANAGLILPATLALRLGLPQLLRKHLDLGGAPGRANTGDKMCEGRRDNVPPGRSSAEMWRLKTVPPVAFNQERPNLIEGGLDVQGGDVPASSQGLFRRRDERPRGGPSVRATPGHGAQDARVLRAPRVSTATTGSQTEARSI